MIHVRERLENEHATSQSTTQATSQSKSATVADEQESRRGFLKRSLAGTGSLAAWLAVAGGATYAERAHAMEEDEVRKKRMLRRGVRKVVDLTHTFSPSFPSFGGFSPISVKKVADYDNVKFNVHKYDIFEHAGTHMDAPLHVTKDGTSSDEIPARQLVVPLIKIDLRDKADKNPDAQLTVDDLKAWEKKNGKIPENACVAMDSGWSERVVGKKFRNADAKGVMHFPGFHAEAADFLLKERAVNGIAVDTLSLDHGPSSDFAVHYAWLPQNKWGLECVANLDQIPTKGAVLVAGVQKIEGGTGGLTRLIALM